MDSPILKVKRLDTRAKLPSRAHPGDLGFDLFALETVGVQPGQVVSAKTGVAFQFPEGWGALVRPRSSQGKAGIHILGGVVDNGYTGQVVVMLYNTADPHSEGTVIYNAGDKIAQLVLVPVFPGTIQETSNLDQTDRGDKGFGSSGK